MNEPRKEAKRKKKKNCPKWPRNQLSDDCKRDGKIRMNGIAVTA